MLMGKFTKKGREFDSTILRLPQATLNRTAEYARENIERGQRACGSTLIGRLKFMECDVHNTCMLISAAVLEKNE